MIFDADAMGLRFIATGASLRDASYSLRLAAGSFQAATGALDGNADGTAGDDFTTSFTGPAGGAAVLAIGEIARGAGQSLAQPTVRPGMAITLSGAAGLTELAFRLDFDAAVFDITGLQLGTGLPAGSTLEVVSLSEGSLSAVLRLGAALASDGAITIGYLLGAIDASAVAGATGLLDLSVTAVTGIASVQDDDGFATAQMVGDLDGDGAYTAADYQAMLATSLSDAPRSGMIDFTVLADMNGDGAITVTDRTLLFRASRGVISPQVPALATVNQTGAMAAASLSTAPAPAAITTPTPAAPAVPAVVALPAPAAVSAVTGAVATGPVTGLLDLSARASNFGLSAASGSALSAPKVTSLLAARRTLM
ncbi:MAG: hypothetical protein IE922_02000 [Sphingomonadales bacterium]|nr:hypothetical protein [Sphingomonadales bacterium]